MGKWGGWWIYKTWVMGVERKCLQIPSPSCFFPGLCECQLYRGNKVFIICLYNVNPY